MSEVSKEVIDMSQKIASVLSYDAESHTFTVPKDTFKTCIPEHLSEKIIKEVNDFQTDFVAAGAKAVGEASIDKLKEDKKIDRVFAELAMQGRNKASYAMDRTKTYENRLGNGEKVEKFGVLTTKYHVRTGRNVGELAAINTELQAMAAKVLK